MKDTYFPVDAPLLVFIGPSGVGKTTIVTKLVEKKLVDIESSYTTRPLRHDESKNTLEHVFVTEPEFNRLKEKGLFLDTVQPFSLPYLYALPRLSLPKKGSVKAIILRASFIPLVSKHHQNFVIYQIEDTKEKIVERLTKRSSASEELTARLAEYEKEISLGREIAHRIFINTEHIEDTVTKIATALREDFSQLLGDTSE